MGRNYESRDRKYHKKRYGMREDGRSVKWIQRLILQRLEEKKNGRNTSGNSRS